MDEIEIAYCQVVQLSLQLLYVHELACDEKKQTCDHDCLLN